MEWFDDSDLHLGSEWSQEGQGGKNDFFSALDLVGQLSPVTPPSGPIPPAITLPASTRARQRAGTSESEVAGDLAQKKKKRTNDPSPEDALAKMRDEFPADSKFLVVLEGRLHCNLCGVSFGTRKKRSQ
jgi:hypothetical protein